MERFLADSEILYMVKAGMLSLVLEPRNKLFMFVIALSLALLYLLLFTLEFYIHFHLLFTSIIFTCQFALSKLRRQLSTSTRCLEKYRGEVLEFFIENLTSLLNLS